MNNIYTVRELRELAGMSQQKFANYFGIPRRTLQNWEAPPTCKDRHACPPYLLALLEYKLTHEKIIDLTPD